MIALLDVGNTRAKYCIVNEGQRDSPQVVLTKELTDCFLSNNFKGISKIIVASVSDDKITDAISIWCKSNQVDFKQIVSEKRKNTVVNAYTIPSQLGVDRWLTLIAVADLFPNRNVLIIDTGTATTLDFLLSDGVHQGGWILAGIQTLVTSVLENTKQVKVNNLETASIAFGLNTSENVHNAAWASTTGIIDSAITQIQKQGYILDCIVITGGNGRLLSSLLTQPNVVIEDLVFTGLYAYI